MSALAGILMPNLSIDSPICYPSHYRALTPNKTEPYTTLMSGRDGLKNPLNDIELLKVISGISYLATSRIPKEIWHISIRQCHLESS